MRLDGRGEFFGRMIGVPRPVACTDPAQFSPSGGLRCFELTYWARLFSDRSSRPPGTWRSEPMQASATSAWATNSTTIGGLSARLSQRSARRVWLRPASPPVSATPRTI